MKENLIPPLKAGILIIVNKSFKPSLFPPLLSEKCQSEELSKLPNYPSIILSESPEAFYFGPDFKSFLKQAHSVQNRRPVR